MQTHVIAGNTVEQIAAVPPCIKVYPHFFVFLDLRCNNFPESVLVLQGIIVGISVHRIKTMHQCRCRTDPQMRHTIGALVPANRIIDLLHQIFCEPAFPGDISRDSGSVIDLVHIEIHSGIHFQQLKRRQQTHCQDHQFSRQHPAVGMRHFRSPQYRCRQCELQIPVRRIQPIEPVDLKIV